jgi:CspA family cold shock protein
MVRGSIKKVIPGRGFGFIRSEGGRDIFFHRSAVQGRAFGRLREGTPVEFNVEDTRKGPRATAVRLGARDGGRRVVEQMATPE